MHRRTAIVALALGLLALGAPRGARGDDPASQAAPPAPPAQLPDAFAEALKDMGVDWGQGYLLARPDPGPEPSPGS